MSSPLTTDAKYALYAGGAITLILAILEDAIVDPTQKDVAEDKPLGSFSRFGDLMGQMIPNAAYMIGFYAHGLIEKNQNSKARSLLMLKASAYSSLVTTVLKYTVRERRPNGSDRASFPSGHTTTIFSFASVVGAEHGPYYGAGAYSLAALVAFSRMNDNMHYLHDVTAGATIGMSYGLGLYYQKKMGGETAVSDSWPLQILPTDKLDGIILFTGSTF